MSRYDKVAIVLVVLVLVSGVPIHVSGQPPDFTQEEAAYQQALQYVEQHRRNNVTITILDQTGHPLNNANVSYQQTSHDFIFGIFGSQWAIPESSDARGWALYSKLCSVNSEVELDWEMWASIEPAPGMFQWKTADGAFRTILSHCPNARFVLMFDDLACCGDKVAGWTGISNLSDPNVFAKFEEYLHDYVYQVVRRYGDRVDWWITENELNAPPASDTLGSMEKEIDVDRTVVQAIRDANTDSRIILMAGLYPRYATSDPVYFSRQAFASGIQVDGVSIEAYPSRGDGDIRRTPIFYEQYAENMASVLHKPVFVQETGYPSQPCAACGTRDYATAWNGVFDEPLQAAWVKYMTTDTFGTEGVMGVVNFPYHTPTPTGLFRDFGLFTTDGKAKEAYYTLLSQIQMFTTSGSNLTNDQGAIAFRGFAGDYEITVRIPNGQSIGQRIHVSALSNSTCAGEEKITLTVGTNPTAPLTSAYCYVASTSTTLASFTTGSIVSSQPLYVPTITNPLLLAALLAVASILVVIAAASRRIKKTG